MKKKKGKLIVRIILYIILFLIIAVMSACCYFCYLFTTPVSKESEEVTIQIENGSSMKTIVSTLKEEDLIRNEYFALIYIKINNVSDLKAGNYILDKNMKLRELFKTLKKGSNVTEKTVMITFNEGKNMRGFASIIDKKTSNSYDEVFKTLEDQEYMKELINKYWFLDETILSKDIYYPLEGYLAPDTYEFKVNASVKDIFEKLLDQTDKILSESKTEIENNKLSTHQIITLASMVESEGVTLDDRKNIAGVFMNRLNNGMSLGSDVTTYYAFKVDLGERDLYKSELNSNNPYNTRSTANAGKLPVGPICNPSKEAILASINYTANDYLYFVADKNMKVYFNKTDADHNKTIRELKNSGLWYEYN